MNHPCSGQKKNDAAERPILLLALCLFQISSHYDVPGCRVLAAPVYDGRDYLLVIYAVATGVRWRYQGYVSGRSVYGGDETADPALCPELEYKLKPVDGICVLLGEPLCDGECHLPLLYPPRQRAGHVLDGVYLQYPGCVVIAAHVYKLWPYPRPLRIGDV